MFLVVVAEGPWIELACLLPYCRWFPESRKNFPEVARLLQREGREGSDSPSDKYDVLVLKKVAPQVKAFVLYFSERLFFFFADS